MGTNFYYNPENAQTVHIGKRSAMGLNKGCRFTWAVDKDKFMERDSKDIVFDEYGNTMTQAEFWEMFDRDVRTENFDLVDMEFS